MKKFVLIFPIVILATLFMFMKNDFINLKKIFFLHKQIEHVNQIEKYSIDIKLEKCTSENFMTDDMNNCTNEGIEAWNKEILNYSKQIEKHLNKEELQLFAKTQIAWEEYYKKEKVFLTKTIAQKNGDIHTTMAIGDLYELSKQRALSLKSYLMQLSD